MTQLKTREFKKMTLDEAVQCKRNAEADKQYLEFFMIYTNSRED